MSQLNTESDDKTQQLQILIPSEILTERPFIIQPLTSSLPVVTYSNMNNKNDNQGSMYFGRVSRQRLITAVSLLSLVYFYMLAVQKQNQVPTQNVEGASSPDNIVLEEDMNNPFMDIVKGKAPATIVYDDEKVMCIKSIRPLTPVHNIIIPKTYVHNMLSNSSNAEIMGQMLWGAKMCAQTENLTNGYRIVINNGINGGQAVKHMHMHLFGGKQLGWPPV